MNPLEFKSKILESRNLNWLNTVKITFKLNHLSYSSEFTGIATFYEFLFNQKKGWMEIGNEIPIEFKNSREFFINQSNKVKSFLDNYSHSDVEYQIRNSWNSLISEMNSAGIKAFLYDNPETVFLLNVHKNKPKSFQGAYEYILTVKNENSEIHSLIGKILAYEFTNKGNTITMRKEAEKASLNKLRSTYETYMSKADGQLINLLKETKENFDKSISYFENMKNEKAKQYEDWETLIKDENSTFYNNASDKFTKLEETYRSQLKLKEPAKYWKDRSEKLRLQGRNLMILVIVLVFIAITFLGELLWNSPESIFISWTAADKSPAIRWSIIFITLLSFIYLAIRSLSKYMFSTFHLARDCEERYTLTYFYLSLLKDTQIDPNERQLIMQSLFSRADTGLLKEDSSPAMPNDVISILKK